jgi:hypothetical protein
MIKIVYGPYDKSPVNRTDIFNSDGKLLRWKHEGKDWNTPRSPVQLRGYSTIKNRNDYQPLVWDNEELCIRLICGEYSIVTSFGKCDFIEERPILSIDTHFEE